MKRVSRLHTPSGPRFRGATKSQFDQALYSKTHSQFHRHFSSQKHTGQHFIYIHLRRLAALTLPLPHSHSLSLSCPSHGNERSAWLRSVEKYGRGHFSTANSGGDLVRRRLLSHLFLKRFHHGPFFFERLPGETSRRRRQIQKSGATAAADRVRHFTMGLWYCTKDTAPLVCPGAVWVRLIGITLQQARRGISRRSSTSTAKGPSCWTGGGRLRRNVS